jgi:hypothetical protein
MPDWGDVLKEVQQRTAQCQMQAQAMGAAAQQALDVVRRKYLAELRAYTGRNVIAYYSGWLSKPGIAQTDINDEDKNGFMMAVHGISKADRKLGLDLFLHTSSTTCTRCSVTTLEQSCRRLPCRQGR